MVCDINTERDSGTSVSKQQEPSMYSSCPCVTLVVCVCVSAGSDACGNHRGFLCLVFLTSYSPGHHEPKHPCLFSVIFLRKGQSNNDV